MSSPNINKVPQSRLYPNQHSSTYTSNSSNSINSKVNNLNLSTAHIRSNSGSIDSTSSGSSSSEGSSGKNTPTVPIPKRFGSPIPSYLMKPSSLPSLGIRQSLNNSPDYRNEQKHDNYFDDIAIPSRPTSIKPLDSRRSSLSHIRSVSPELAATSKILKYLTTYFGELSAVYKEIKLSLTDEKIKQTILATFNSFRNYRKQVEGKAEDIFKVYCEDNSYEVNIDEFVNSSPKGELHCHLSGAMSPKDVIIQAKAKNLQYNLKDKVFVSADAISVDTCDVADITKTAETILSMKGAVSEDRQKHFFEVCKTAESVTNLLKVDEMLVVYLKDAAAENVYLSEIMVDFKILDTNFSDEYKKLFLTSPKNSPESSPKVTPVHLPLHESGSFDDDILENNWGQALSILQTSGWIEKYVNAWTSTLVEYNNKVDKALKNDLEQNELLKPEYFYLIEIMRDGAFDQDMVFFATIAAAMALEYNGRKNIDQFVGIVGLNLVGPEHEIQSRHNFPTQMKMLSFLKKKFENPKVSLHAGEFSNEGKVNSFDVTNQLNLSAETADRIGHGTAIAKAQKARTTLLDNDKPVEICLTSNESTMRIKPEANPIRYYLQHGISVVLGADDPGIFQTNLSNEYLKGIKAHKWEYKVYKNILRNAVHYSFIPGESIFIKSSHDKLLHLHPKFWGIHNEGELSGTVQQLITNSRKAALQYRMEKKLIELEGVLIKNYNPNN